MLSTSLGILCLLLFAVLAISAIALWMRKPTRRRVVVRRWRGRSLFDDVPDFVVLEILSWLVAVERGKEGEGKGTLPMLGQIRDLVRFGSTCKRFRELHRHHELWRSVDFGFLLDSFIGDITQRVVDVLKLPQVAACETYTVGNLSQPMDVAMMLKMPNLRRVELDLSDSTEDCDHQLLRVLPEDLFTSDCKIEARLFLRLVRGLDRLERLAVDASDFDDDAGQLVSLKLPQTVRELELHAGYAVIATLLAAGPFPQVVKLTGIAAALALRSCPNAASVECDGDEAFTTVITTAPRLQEITAVFLHLASFSDLSSVPSATNLRCVRMDFLGTSLHKVMVETMCRTCPNISTLRIKRAFIRTEEIAALSMLRNLEDLEITVHDEEDPEQVVCAFEELGNAPAVPFRRFALTGVSANIQQFWTSRRLGQLQELGLNDCKIDMVAALALSENVRGSLTTTKFNGDSASCASAILANCLNVDWVSLKSPSLGDFSKIGRESRAPFKHFSIRPHMLSSRAADALAPALHSVVDLTIHGHPTPSFALKIATSCKYLAKIRMNYSLSRQIAAFIPAHVKILE